MLATPEVKFNPAI